MGVVLGVLVMTVAMTRALGNKKGGRSFSDSLKTAKGNIWRARSASRSVSASDGRNPLISSFAEENPRASYGTDQ